MPAPRIEVTGEPDPDDYLRLWAPLLAFNQQAVGDAESRPFAILLRDPDSNALLGGLWARSLWGSFYIDMIVLTEPLRGQGLGADLMRRAEAEARDRGCHLMWLDTYAFQARDFYVGLDFEEFGRLEGPAPVYPRFFMRKTLAEPPPG